MIYNIGAICGGILFGSLSERFGRRRASSSRRCCRLPVIPLWAFSASPVLLAIGAFLMQFCRAGRVGRRAGASQRTVAGDRARHLSRASSISSAICSRRSTPRCRPASPRISAAITASRSPLSRGRRDHHRRADGDGHRGQGHQICPGCRVNDKLLCADRRCEAVV